HVAHHALRAGDRARELVADRVAGLILWNRRVQGSGLAPAVLRVRTGVLRVAVVAVDGVAGRATGGAGVARLGVRAEEPQVRIVQARLRDVDEGTRDAVAGRGSAVRRADVGPARLVELLQRAGRVWQAHFRELRGDHAAAALEHAEHVGGRRRFPPPPRRERKADGLLGAEPVR